MKQVEHHKKRNFIEEYEEMLKEFEIDYDNRFVFKLVDYTVPDGTGENSLVVFLPVLRP